MNIDLLTPTQREAWDMHQNGMSVAQIARQLSRNPKTVSERLKRAKEKMDQDIDPAIIDVMRQIGTGMVPNEVWVKTKGYSAKLRPNQVSDETFAESVLKMMIGLPPAMPVPKPISSEEDLMAVYPIFDAHLGMLAHEQISGKSVTLQSAKDEVISVMTEIIGRTPNARRGIIINGGDFTHQTDDRNMTRRSGHILDVSARNSVTIEAAIEVLATLIEMALTKHETVEYYSVPGNHDPQNWETIQFAMRERYRNNPRVKIDVRWDEFSVIEHGKVTLFIHHGNKRTPKDLAMFRSAAFADQWGGKDQYRMLITGHNHHLKMDEMTGIIWYQVAAACARDHHAASHAYISNRLLSSMVFDLRCKRFGYDGMI